MRKFTTILVCGLVLLLAQIAIQAQTGGSVAGNVMDPNKAVVAGAVVVVSNNDTKEEFTAITNDEGFFRIPNVSSGVYTATVTGKGFKKSIVTQIKVDVGSPSTVNVQMEVGGAAEQVTVVGGGELLRTENSTVGNTLTGRQITDIPTASRNALDLVLAMPGTATPGRPRTSSVNGLPKAALNITLDGINVQDNLLKSSDGFFTYIQPKTDAIGEVTVSTSNPGSESSSEGSVQIKFVTQNGTNEYHGGVYWYHRDPYFNANYWFNNRDVKPLPGFTTAPQSFIILNQPGFKIGGPISIPKLFSGKDKAFFFMNYEEYRLPERTLRTKLIMSPQAQAGIHRFFAPSVPAGLTPFTTCVDTGASGATKFICSTNVLALGQNQGLAFGTVDPTIGPLLQSIRSSVSGYDIKDTADLNVQTVSFINPGGQLRRFPTIRFDFNPFKNHHIENIWNYQQFTSQVDFLNSVDPAFPGFPNFGSQASIRFSNSTAWRWNITQTIVNEARFGLTGGSTLFFPEINAGQFVNQGGYSQGINQAGVNQATVSTGPQRRNSPVKQFNDTLTWVHGNHSFNFGANVTRINFWQQLVTVVPSTTFVPNGTNDPAGLNAFASLGSQQGGAASLYAVLAGRLSAINANARLNEDTNKYKFLGDLISRAQQTEYGIFGQDTWRVRPNLTLTLGVRYEKQLPFMPLNDTYAATTYADLYGESGVNNLFKPGQMSNTSVLNVVGGVCANCTSTYNLYKNGTAAYEADSGTWAPSLGFAYQPNFDKGFMHKLVGNPGQTVLRGGFSVATIREGTNTFQSIFAANPGGSITANRSITLGNLAAGTYLRQGPFGAPTIPDSPTYPGKGLITDSVNAFSPTMKIGYVESWSFGIQRELTSNMAIEVRYIGNRGHQLWRQYDLNELNVIENGFFNEFKLAQQNYIANMANGRGNQFRYQGPGTGTSPLPIMFGYLQGSAPANAGACADVASCNTLYSNANFASATYLAFLNPLNPSVTGFGANLAATGFDLRRTGAAPFFPFNQFIANAGKRGGAFVVDNGGQSYYDAMTIEFRRRLSRGLLIQGNYTFSKALSNTYASSSAAFDQPNTLRNPALRKGIAPFDITQSVKANFIYELPIGRGKSLFGDSKGWVNKIIGDWGFNGNIRLQSGSPVQVGNAQLVGMTQQELQKAVGIYKGEADADGVVRGNVFFLPFAIRQQTFRAFSGVITAGVPVYTNGAPTGAFLAPATYGNCLQAYAGGCGTANMVIHGPAFFRSDLSIIKKVRFTERMNLEFRGEFLNAFNNINFVVGAAGNDLNGIGAGGSAQFGRFTAAYQDLSTTNDPGGRLVQFVVRFNF